MGQSIFIQAGHMPAKMNFEPSHRRTEDTFSTFASRIGQLDRLDLLQVLERPATSVTCALLGGIFAYITAHGIGYEQVGLSHEKAVGRWELWRVVTGEGLSNMIFHGSCTCCVAWLYHSHKTPEGKLSCKGISICSDAASCGRKPVWVLIRCVSICLCSAAKPCGASASALQSDHSLVHRRL